MFFIFSENVCDTEFATNITFKVVTSILNFYIPTALITALYVRIFIAIKQRSKDICKFGAYTASGIKSSGPQSRGSIVNQLERHGAFWQDFLFFYNYFLF